MDEIDQYREQVLYLLYDWKIHHNPTSEEEAEDMSQFLEKPTLNQHLITPAEIEESRRLSITYCTHYTTHEANMLPLQAIVYKGASILWLRCNKYVDTRDETGAYVVSYGDYLEKECHKLLKLYKPQYTWGLRDVLRSSEYFNGEYDDL